MSKTASTDRVPLEIQASHVARDWKHEAPMLGCRYHPSGDLVFGSAMDHSIRRCDFKQERYTAFRGHESWLRGIGFSPDGKQMFSGGYDGRLCFWDAYAEAADGAAVTPLKTIQAHDGWIRALEVSPDGNTVATAGNDLKVRLWSTDSGEMTHEFGSHEKHIYSLLFSPTDGWLLSGDLKGVINQWDLITGKLIRALDAKALYTYHGGQRVDYGGVRCMSLSVDGKQLACGGLHKATNPFAGVQEPLVVVFDWEKGEQIRTHEATEIPRGIVWRLVFEPDGTLISGIGGDAGYVLFWNSEKTETHKLKLRSPVLDMDRHPSQPEVVVANHDGRLRIVRMTKPA